MPRSPAPARARRKAPDKAPSPRAAAPRRKASTSQAVTVAPPVAQITEDMPPAARARRTKAPAPMADKRQAPQRAAKAQDKTPSKPAPRKKPAKPVATRGAVQAVTTAAPAPRRARRRESTAEVLNALDQGFVPKAPPPTAPAHAKPGEPAAHEHQGGSVEASPAGTRLSASLPAKLPARLPALEPAAQPWHDPLSGTAALPAVPLAAAPLRLRCPGCDYPLARQARFCRRCGVAQRPSGTLPLAAEQRPAATDTPWAAGVLRPAGGSELTHAEIESLHVDIESVCVTCGAPMPGSTRFCRSCEGRNADSIPAQSTLAATTADGVSSLAEDFTGSGVAGIRCHACGESLPGVARFCMFCAAPQGVERAQPPHRPLPDDSHAQGEAAVDRESHPGKSPESLEPASQSVSSPIDAMPVDAASSETAPPPDAPGGDAPPDAQPAGEIIATDPAPRAVAETTELRTGHPTESAVDEPAPLPPDHSGTPASTAASGDATETASVQPPSAPHPSDPHPSNISQDDLPSKERAPQPAAGVSAPAITAEPSPPAATVTLLEPDVVERLARARDEIDEIGRSIDGLARTLPTNSVTVRRPSALPPRRR